MKVIIIDDVPDNCGLLQTILANHGIQSEVLTGGQQALNRLLGDPVDVVLLDWMMPYVAGYEVLRAIRQNALWACVPVIITTAVPHGELQDVITSSPRTEIIYKPFDVDKLLDLLKSL